MYQMCNFEIHQKYFGVESLDEHKIVWWMYRKNWNLPEYIQINAIHAKTYFIITYITSESIKSTSTRPIFPVSEWILKEKAVNGIHLSALYDIAYINYFLHVNDYETAGWH